LLRRPRLYRSCSAIDEEEEEEDEEEEEEEEEANAVGLIAMSWNAETRNSSVPQKLFHFCGNLRCDPTPTRERIVQQHGEKV
jgi:hypothetical protein